MIGYREFVEFFNGIEMDEKTHQYRIKNGADGLCIDTSVSKFIHRFSNPFDEDRMAELVAKRDGKTKQEVLDGWKEATKKACDFGSETHLFAERYFSKRLCDSTFMPIGPHQYAVTDFYSKLPNFVKPCFAEAKMYHKKYLIAGTCDLLLYNEDTDSYIIADWKTNRDLHKNYKGQKLLEPFTDMLDSPLSLYELQLSMYQILLEQIPYIKVSTRKVVWLRESGFEVYECRDFRDRLLNVLEKCSLEN